MARAAARAWWAFICDLRWTESTSIRRLVNEPVGTREADEAVVLTEADPEKEGTVAEDEAEAEQLQ